MLHRLDALYAMTIGAVDGDVGKIKDVYFDDRHWAVRYLVVDAGAWLEFRQVLISPISVLGVDWNDHAVRVDLTRQQVRDSPPIDSDKPVSRQHELEFLDYYGYPDYWTGAMLWGATPYPLLPARPPEKAFEAAIENEAGASDPHLHSAREAAGYQLQASDDPIGHIAGFLIEDRSWAIRYIEIDTRNWWPGKHVLIPAPWMRSINWPERTAEVDVARAVVKTAPSYDSAVTPDRDDEERLYAHYSRPAYWL